jgi:hypothetical protein
LRGGLALLLLTHLPEPVLSTLLLLGLPHLLLTGLLFLLLLPFGRAASSAAIALERATRHSSTFTRLDGILGRRAHVVEDGDWSFCALGAAGDLV